MWPRQSFTWECEISGNIYEDEARGSREEGFYMAKRHPKKKERKVYDRNVIYVVSYDFTILVGGCYKLVFTVLFCPLRKPSTEMPTKSGASSWSNCKARAWQQVTAPDHLNFNPSLLVYIDTYHYSDTVIIYDNANNDSI
jgi:hypothetical protein